MSDLWAAVQDAARLAADTTGGGETYHATLDAEIQRLEEQYGELLSDADLELIHATSFGGTPVDAGLRDPLYEEALRKQAEKDAA